MMEDEEIVLGNSPLDEYLQQVTDIPFPKYSSTSIDNELNQLSPTTQSNWKRKDIFNRIRHKLENWIPVFCHRNKNNIGLKLLSSMITICDSNILQEDDHARIVDLKEVFILKEKQLLSNVQQQNTPFSRYFAERNTAMKIAVFVLLLGIAVMQYQQIFLKLFFALISMLLIWYLFTHRNTTDQQLALQSCFEDFVGKFSCFDLCVDKSIKHLKEVEVINHGIPVFNNKLPGTNLVKTNTKKCLPLQHCLLDILVELFTETRKHANLLVNGYSKQLFFYKEEFMSSISHSNLEDLISRNKDENLGLKVVPLNKLKSIVYLYRIILSEFLLSSIICVHSVLQRKLGNDVLDELITSFRHILKIHDNRSQDLKEVLKKSIEDVFKKQETAQQRIVMKQTDCKDTLFNSCKLNIYSSLSRMEEMEELLKTGDNNKLVDADIAAFENLLMQFNLNIDNAKACIEDIYSLHKPERTVTTNEEANTSNVENNALDEDQPTLFVPREKDGDLLFEGESRGQDASNLNTYSDLEELEKAAKESKESRRLLRELKTIFSVKESPVGLLKFPLQKVSVDGPNVEVCDETAGENKGTRNFPREKQPENETFTAVNDDEQETTRDENDEPVVRIGLPAGFLNTIQGFPSRTTEETFGGNSEEESD